MRLVQIKLHILNLINHTRQKAKNAKAKLQFEQQRHKKRKTKSVATPYYALRSVNSLNTKRNERIYSTPQHRRSAWTNYVCETICDHTNFG